VQGCSLDIRPPKHRGLWALWWNSANKSGIVQHHFCWSLEEEQELSLRGKGGIGITNEAPLPITASPEINDQTDDPIHSVRKGIERN